MLESEYSTSLRRHTQTMTGRIDGFSHFCVFLSCYRWTEAHKNFIVFWNQDVQRLREGHLSNYVGVKNLTRSYRNI